MNIYDYEEAFGAWDKTTRRMRQEIADWFDLYYRLVPVEGSDPCQRIAYTVVNKLTKTVFGEYKAASNEPFVQEVIRALDERRKDAMQLALVGGECYLKPYAGERRLSFVLIPRNNVLIFGRNARGEPTDMGTVEKTTWGSHYYTLLERRTVDGWGYLTIENKLYRSSSSQSLGKRVSLREHPDYKMLRDTYTYASPLYSIGLVRLKTPMLNCVDGSADPVSVYAPAVGLIHNIDRNEAQLNGEFSRGESRIFLSSDLLRTDPTGKRELSDHLFVGLDEDTERLGMTIFSPQLRYSAFLERKQEYMRNVESVIGLKRGMLSDANAEDRTATEIASSAGDYNLTVIDFQEMWEAAVRQAAALCCKLGKLYNLDNVPEDTQVSIDWGNGVLYDEDKTWQTYKDMVAAGLLRPEIALGWRFNMPTETEEDLAAVRKKYMPY